jgi:hypothetical protein
MHFTWTHLITVGYLYSLLQLFLITFISSMSTNVTQNAVPKSWSSTWSYTMHIHMYMYTSDVILEYNAYLFCYCQIFTVEDNKIGLFFYMKFYCHLTWNAEQFQYSETCDKRIHGICLTLNVMEQKITISPGTMGLTTSFNLG